MYSLTHVCVCLIHGCTFIMQVFRSLMSKVHCSTPHTSNVTNNFFLQLYCSNPFSGLGNGNIITFLWCSAFDKTAACWAECLTELDSSSKPSSLSTHYFPLLLTTLYLFSLFSVFTSLLFVLSPQLLHSVISQSSFCLSLSFSLSHPSRYCSG